MSDEPTQGGTAEAEPTTEQGPNIAAIAERMDSFAQELGGLREALTEPEPEYGQEPYGFDYVDPSQLAGQGYPQPSPVQQQFAPGYGQQPYAPQQPYAGQPDPYGQYQPQPQFGQPGMQPGQPQFMDDGYGNMVPVPQQPQQQFQQQQEDPRLAEVLQTVQGLQTQFERQQVLGKVAEYEARYPELKKPEVFRPAAEAAAAKAQEMGRPDLAGDPEWVVTHWLAERAANSAGSETPAGSAQEMQLEQPGGVAPAQPEVDPGDAIVDAFTSKRPPW